MNTSIPDTALAQSLETLHGVRGVALSCIAAGALVTLLRAVAPEIPLGVIVLAQTAIMAMLGFAATRYFLTDGKIATRGPADVLRDPGFGVFLKLELFVGCFVAILQTMGDIDSVPGSVLTLGWIGLLVGLARYGTVFPAAAMGGDASLQAALDRNTTRALLWRLVASQVLILLILSTLVLLPGSLMETGAGLDSTLGLAVMAPLTAAVSAFGTVLVAVILSKAYRGRYKL